MTAPTPGDVFGAPLSAAARADRLAAIGSALTAAGSALGAPRASARFFDGTGGPVQRRRARALTATVKSLEDTLAAARALFREQHLDLNVERYRREVDHLDDVLQELDDALADPAGPPPPPPAPRLARGH